jgi:alpha-L-rhamnosidase
MLPDGTINPGEMTSFNHYALGAIADWLHKYVGGIRPLAPGYSRVLIAPLPGEGIDWAKTTLRSPHGTIAVEWRTTGNGVLEVEATIPDGVEAEIRLPGQDGRSVGAGTHRLTAAVSAAVAS